MASPTISDLERVHKEQLGNILTSWDFFYAMLKKYYSQGKSKQSPEVKNLNKLAIDVYLPLTTKWIVRQIKYEIAGGVPKTNVMHNGILNDFIQGSKYFYIRPYLAKWIAGTQQTSGEGSMGFIPLIWAAVIIIGFFVTERIIDDMNSTADEQAELVKATSDFCKDNKLSPADCKSMLQQQNQSLADQNSSSGIFGNLGKILLWGGLAFVAVKYVVPQFTSKKSTANV